MSSMKGYREIVKTAKLLDYYQQQQFWVEVRQDENRTYYSYFTDNYFDLPHTIKYEQHNS
jgi:hypothetical protein